MVLLIHIKAIKGGFCGCTDRFAAQMFIKCDNSGNIAQQLRHRLSEILHLNICKHLLLSDSPRLDGSMLSISCCSSPLLSFPRARDP